MGEKRLLSTEVEIKWVLLTMKSIYYAIESTEVEIKWVLLTEEYIERMNKIYRSRN